MSTASNQGSTGLDWLDQWLNSQFGNRVTSQPQAQNPMTQLNQTIGQQLNPIQFESLEKAYRKQTDMHAQEFIQSHGAEAAAQLLSAGGRMPTDNQQVTAGKSTTNTNQEQGMNMGLPPGSIKQATNAFQRGGWVQDANGNVSWQNPGWFAQNIYGYPNETAAGIPGEAQKLSGQQPLQKGQREAAISQALFELPNQFIEQEKAAAQAIPQLRSIMTAGEKAGTLLGIQPESLKLQKRIIQGSAQGGGTALINKLMRIKELQGMQGKQGQVQHTPQQITAYNKARASGLSIEEAKKKAGF